MFDKIYELSLSRNYVSRWGLAEAVRELIQNALDSSSPFVYEFSEQDDGAKQLRLTSEFTTLTPQTLLLGATSKADDQDAIGSFGEGYKIALLVLTRLGYEVVMHNGDVDWHPSFRHHKKFNEELLVIEELAARDKTNKGLNVEISGLDNDDVAAIIDSCLRMQEHVGEVKLTKFGDILLERPGKLYVGGLFICKIEAHYGYNIKPQFLRLERDRQTVSTFDLFDVTRDMWYETKEFDRIAVMIDQDVPDLRYARYSAPDMVKQACYELFRKNHPGAVVAETQDQLKQLVAQGMERVVVVTAGMYHSVSTSTSYRTERPIKLISPAERMEAFFAVHKFNMHDTVKRAFDKLIDEAKGWRLK